MPTDFVLPFELNLVDVVVLVVVLLFVLDDLRRGVLFGLLDLVGFLAALLAALLLYGRLSGLIVEHTPIPYAIAKPVAFGLCWLATDIVLGITLRRALRRPAVAVAMTAPGRWLGAVTGVARGLVAAMLTIAVLSTLPIPEPVQRAIEGSRFASYLGDRSAALQRAMSNVVDDAVQETLGLLTVRPESNERVELRFTVARPEIDELAETQMLQLVNQERTKAGLGPLTMDPAIRNVARDYSVAMFRQGYFSHVDQTGSTPFDRMRRGGVRFGTAGENLALAPTVTIAHEGLMNSPGHRANILNGRFWRVGIGVADGGLHGKMFTQNFAD